MMKRGYIIIELFLLFIALPVSLLLPYPLWLKILFIAVGFGYTIYVLLKKTSVSFKVKKDIEWASFFKDVAIKFLVIAIITTLYVYVVDAAKLFCVPRSDLKLWVFILFLYSFFSVWPQELIYRAFFFERYERLFKDKRLLIFVNAIIFSLAHLLFKNRLVLVLTFLGGLLFAYTYKKRRSTTLVSIEHALYGNWLFTVGMGEMLAFPGMESC